MDINSDDCFTLGHVFISPSHNQLKVAEETIKLQPKVMSVLLYLAQHHERVISNDELIEKLWPGRVVSHGSVQKSINSLRSTLADIFGEQEVIENFSKRGYQLKVPPIFIVNNTTPLQASDSNHPHSIWRKLISQWRWPIGLVIFALVSIAVFIYQPFVTDHLPMDKQHKTIFNKMSSYTTDIGHEVNALPHPNNQHLVYVRQTNNSTTNEAHLSQLLISDQLGNEWNIAQSDGLWFNYAWSPNGQHLAAIEQQRIDSSSLTADFYEKPNYLYTFHIFSLDLNHQRLLEKHLLSQWQGQLNSISWADNHNIEFVAMQGNNAYFSRFRYAPLEQRLVLLDTLDFAPLPLSSTTLNNHSVITSRYKQGLKIDFIDDKQLALATYTIDDPQADISWVPDGSGVLVHARAQQRLYILYLDGERLDIPLHKEKNSHIFNPRFSPDGQKIYYTESHLQSEIWSYDLNGNERKLIDNQQLNYAGSFANSGEKYVYSSVRSNQIQLWLVENGQEQQLTRNDLDEEISSILWTDKDRSIVYKSGATFYLYDLTSHTERTLLNDAADTFPIALSANTSTLTVLITTNDINNLWRINRLNGQRQQLTFGSIGSAKVHNGDIYFQYTGQNGLWRLPKDETGLTLVSDDLEKNSKIVNVDPLGVYYITGGQCRESDIFYKDFKNGTNKVYLARQRQQIQTSDFHPQKGDLHSHCNYPEANILILE